MTKSIWTQWQNNEPPAELYKLNKTTWIYKDHVIRKVASLKQDMPTSVNDGTLRTSDYLSKNDEGEIFKKQPHYKITGPEFYHSSYCKMFPPFTLEDAKLVIDMNGNVQ